MAAVPVQNLVRKNDEKSGSHSEDQMLTMSNEKENLKKKWPPCPSKTLFTRMMRRKIQRSENEKLTMNNEKEHANTVLVQNLSQKC